MCKRIKATPAAERRTAAPGPAPAATFRPPDHCPDCGDYLLPAVCPDCQGDRGWYYDGGTARPLCLACFRYGPADDVPDVCDPVQPHNRLGDALLAALQSCELVIRDRKRYRKVRQSALGLRYLLESFVWGVWQEDGTEWVGTTHSPNEERAFRTRQKAELAARKAVGHA